MVYKEGRMLHQKTDALLGAPALQEVWSQLDQHGSHEREQGILAQMIAQPEFQAVLTAVRALPPTELASQLQADLQASYGALQAGCPTSIHDLRQRMRFVDNIPAQDAPLAVSTELSLEEKRRAAERQSAANTRDYLMQMMMGVKNLADFLAGRPQGDANTPLIQLFKQQEQRLARLLIAIEHDANQDLAKAA